MIVVIVVQQIFAVAVEVLDISPKILVYRPAPRQFDRPPVASGSLKLFLNRAL